MVCAGFSMEAASTMSTKPAGFLERTTKHGAGYLVEQGLIRETELIHDRGTATAAVDHESESTD